MPLLAALLFIPTSLTAQEPEATAYTIEAVRTSPGSDEVIIRLESAKGWHLNGDGYPPISVSIGLSDPPVILSCPGISASAKREWSIRVPLATTEIPLEFEAIACGPSRCLRIREKKSIPILPRD